MTVDSEKRADIVILRIDGRFLGAMHSQPFRNLFDGHRQEGVQRFVVDFSEVDWIDSAGIGAVIAAQISAGKTGGDVRLACLTERVAYYFDICNLDAIFSKYDTVKEAVASYN